MKRVLTFCRPFGFALSGFILLNLLLALRRPSLSATRIWLYLQIPEPLLSAIAGLLGLALLAPHAAAARRSVRLLLAGIFCGFASLSLANVLGFYHALHIGRMGTGIPIPFSAFIVVILLCEAARVIWWAPLVPRLPLPARRFLEGTAVLAAFFLLILAHIVTFGMTDYAPQAEADAAVVLGAKVYPDGSLSHALQDRLDTGIRLLAEGRARYLILSGGVEPGGLSEPRVMAAHARRKGVLEEVLILDENGRNTYASAQSCGEIARKRGFRKLLVVSQYFHNARVKLIFERVGTPCYTVPAPYRPLVREGFFLLREAVAFPFYYLFYC